MIQEKNQNRSESENQSIILCPSSKERNGWKAYLEITKDYGKTWNRIVDQNDVLSYTLSIVEDPIEKNLLFLAAQE